MTDSPISDLRKGPPASVAWSRLSQRMVWVDIAQSLIASLPVLIAYLTGVLATDSGGFWSLIVLAVFGTVGAVFDFWRWLFTRYRVTEQHLEVHSGLIFRSRRSIPLDKIRSVDITARLRHRLSGLRVLAIGSGQQSATGEPALLLNAITVGDSLALKQQLLEAHKSVPVTSKDPLPATQPSEHASSPSEQEGTAEIIARFKARWFLLNMFSIWGYVLAIGLLWGSIWLLGSFGIDGVALAQSVLEWETLELIPALVIAFILVTLLGVLGMAVNFFIEYWDFELSRVMTPESTVLRTRHGLINTKEVNRTEQRIRGVTIVEPLLSRWLRAADTSVITTGLDQNSMSWPAGILPRTTRKTAHEVAGLVLSRLEIAPENAFRQPLTKHPLRSLILRVVFALIVTALTLAALLFLVNIQLLPVSALWGAGALGFIALVTAILSYRALGHRIEEDSVKFCSGVWNRSTSVLQNTATSTVVIRESLLQRAFGLQSIGLMTAAGDGQYMITDLDARESVDTANQATSGTLNQYLVTT